jgi:hypothetical protein
VKLSTEKCGSSCSCTWKACFWKALVCGIFERSEVREGMPQPLAARSWAGLPPKYHSKNFQDASLFLASLGIQKPVAPKQELTRWLPSCGAGAKRETAASLGSPPMSPPNQ